GSAHLGIRGKRHVVEGVAQRIRAELRRLDRELLDRQLVRQERGFADHVGVCRNGQIPEPILDLNQAQIPLLARRSGTRERGIRSLSVSFGRVVIREEELKLQSAEAVLPDKTLLERLDTVPGVAQAVPELDKELFDLSFLGPLTDDADLRPI